MEWFEELDFESNPFVDSSKTVGHEDLIDEMFYHIVSGNILCIEGEDGSGKTQLLKEAIKRFGGKRKVIYVDCAKVHSTLNIEKLLINKSWLFNRLLNMKPTEMILLLDNVEFLSKKNCERIKYFYDQNYLKAIVFTSKDFSKVNFEKSLKHRIRKMIKIPPLTDSIAIQLIRGKVGQELLKDELILGIFDLSKKNTKTFLENTEKVCSRVKDRKDVSYGEIKSIITGEAE
ncbi:AAA family ATPase [Candidatus Woesearchaeota archaeon]|nr:AAA family ATPase [Candidatus Woesearchaeota archaeon]